MPSVSVHGDARRGRRALGPPQRARQPREMRSCRAPSHRGSPAGFRQDVRAPRFPTASGWGSPSGRAACGKQTRPEGPGGNAVVRCRFYPHVGARKHLGRTLGLQYGHANPALGPRETVAQPRKPVERVCAFEPGTLGRELPDVQRVLEGPRHRAAYHSEAPYRCQSGSVRNALICKPRCRGRIPHPERPCGPTEAYPLSQGSPRSTGRADQRGVRHHRPATHRLHDHAPTAGLNAANDLIHVVGNDLSAAL